MKILEISKFGGFLNVELGMTDGSLILRFALPRIVKNCRTETDETRDAKTKPVLSERRVDSR